MNGNLTTVAFARCRAAIELRHAASLRRDLAASTVPRGPAISAIRDCLRHAKALNVAAAFLGGLK